MTRKRDHVIIKRALINEKNVIGSKCMTNLEVYMKSFKENAKYQRKMNNIIKLQSIIKASVLAKKYRKLREKAIIIQRAYRDYIFRKKGAKTLFQTTYKTYADNLLKQNHICRSALYDQVDS